MSLHPDKSRHVRPAAVLPLISLLWLLPLTTLPALAAEQPLERIGQGDPRAGYESADYRTGSRSLARLTGIPADLAGLAASPPLGLPALPDPPAAALIDLGRRLFFDRRLSANETLSCGMCHVPEQAFTQNELATPVGIEGRFVRRNAPALYNVAYRRLLFHDGRETDLRQQIWAPLLAANEMGNPSRASVLQRVTADPGYREDFAALFPEGISEQTLGNALAAYQRTLLSADSPFDRWYYAGDFDAVPPAAKRGFFLFNDAGCARCHSFNQAHAHFTDDAMHRTGVEFASRAREAAPVDRVQIAPGVIITLAPEAARSIQPPARQDEGRKEVTGRVQDLWRYRTPSLRNVAISAPYMHDGSLPNLASVIDFYDQGTGDDPDSDLAGKTLNLTAGQKSDLLAFLNSLTGANVDALAADARSAPIGERQASSNNP